ncbi:MAG: zinc-ribbon domain-containing protein [Firmicutes bacterium]|nr:zinc-ribbon domain-containing protein [Bacillota bacterium]
MFCHNCGAKLIEGANFCESCGAKITAAAEGPKPEPKAKKAAKERPADEDFAKSGTKVTENIYLCPDGKYRWIYEFSMLKNPTILFTVWKVLGISFCILLCIGLVMMLAGGDGFESFFPFAKGLVVMLLFMDFLGVIAYLIVAHQYGWKYMVLFTMDEDGVEHRQMKEQFDKAKAMGWLTVAAGIASGSLSSIAIGLNTATRDRMNSEFKVVRKVKAVRRRHVIYVDELLNKNQVYADTKEDLDFVLDYITQRVPEKARPR